jgi:hypothetical protein
MLHSNPLLSSHPSGVVEQGSNLLLSGTVFFNIAYGKADVSAEQVRSFFLFFFDSMLSQ